MVGVLGNNDCSKNRKLEVSGYTSMNQRQTSKNQVFIQSETLLAEYENVSEP